MDLQKASNLGLAAMPSNGHSVREADSNDSPVPTPKRDGMDPSRPHTSERRSRGEKLFNRW